AFAAAAVVVIAPYGLRNHALNGWMLPTRSGVNLFMSNCRYAADVLPDHSPDILELYAAETLSQWMPVAGPPSPAREGAEDRASTALAVEQMTGDPIGTVRRWTLNVWSFVSPTLVPNRGPRADVQLQVDAQGRALITDEPPRPLVDRVVYTA